jgi:hypothetical protein
MRRMGECGIEKDVPTSPSNTVLAVLFHAVVYLPSHDNPTPLLAPEVCGLRGKGRLALEDGTTIPEMCKLPHSVIAFAGEGLG